MRYTNPDHNRTRDGVRYTRGSERQHTVLCSAFSLLLYCEERQRELWRCRGWGCCLSELQTTFLAGYELCRKWHFCTERTYGPMGSCYPSCRNEGPISRELAAEVTQSVVPASFLGSLCLLPMQCDK